MSVNHGLLANIGGNRSPGTRSLSISSPMLGRPPDPGIPGVRASTQKSSSSETPGAKDSFGNPDPKISAKASSSVRIDEVTLRRQRARRRKFMGKKKTETEIKISNEFEKLGLQQEDGMVIPDLGKDTNSVEIPHSSEPDPTPRTLNPFKNKDKKIMDSDFPSDMEMSEFNFSIKVPVNIEKNIDEFHKKLTDTFSIVVRWDYLTLLTKKHKLDMILLLETHLEKENSEWCIKKLGNNWSGTFVPGNGRAEGIIFAWRNDDFKVKNIYSCSQAMHLSVCKKGCKPWVFLGIYTSNNIKRRKLLWDLLSNLDLSNCPWLIAGDFNCIDNSEDKLGGNPFTFGSSCNSFRSLCAEAGLIDLKFQGARFTWSNNRAGSKKIFARLDRAYANENWLSLYSKTLVFHLSRLTSDHRPIMINTKLENFPDIPRRRFTFELYWLEYKETQEMVSKAWEYQSENSKSMSQFSRTLKKLSTDLEEWSKQVDGIPISQPKDIVDAFANWYKMLWEKEDIPNSNWHNVKDLNWRKLPNNKEAELIKSFSMQEIKDAVNSLGMGKAPGPDGFILEFYINFWETVKELLLNALNEFHSWSKNSREAGLGFYFGDKDNKSFVKGFSSGFIASPLIAEAWAL
ncbi:hypothetical protein Cni_G23249 [Canna indica]|uniref:Endonuclease/exonuclease/phosphatase domain-containing protein n=1 Tax=Canna indica TaxID=4628 RepID=A0AAQ3KTF4_9LILI|nr:hypothetical protein Cni_G23249 [Canna indica]